ncbi:MAG: queuine tRNA-ribosyltransferase queuine tRNA-ribosyltransferase [Parcubacteria group bacterium]|nr:queuine tRNA-ribosyltransferase queuine tRNA-ribosyltransferase [Parcubacteria group bacterium]
MAAFNFKIEAKQGTARAGVITTPHGEIHTPAFSPVGTKASVKGISPRELNELGAEVVLANTYHLYLQPGEKIVEGAGGLAKFMGWEGPTITDSGGFQVFSLGAGFGKSVSKFVKEDVPREEAVTVFDQEVASSHGQLAIIDDEGVTFTSHIDGSLHRFTPERSVEIQHALGADIFFAFDECTAPTEPYEYQKEAMERTHRWAERSLKAHRQNIDANKKQAIFGIAQGGQFDDLRKSSARAIAEMGFDGFGLGGSFSKKYGDDSLESALAMLKELPETMPVHGLGIGEPGDILASIAAGVDIFDCVAATRIGRHGSIYTKRGIIHITGEKYRNDYGSLDPEGVIKGTELYTRAYVAHLIHSKEMLGSIICSLHNVGFTLNLVKEARQAILDGRFIEFRADFMRNYYQAS